MLLECDEDDMLLPCFAVVAESWLSVRELRVAATAWWCRWGESIVVFFDFSHATRRAH